MQLGTLSHGRARQSEKWQSTYYLWLTDKNFIHLYAVFFLSSLNTCTWRLQLLGYVRQLLFTLTVGPSNGYDTLLLEIFTTSNSCVVQDLFENLTTRGKKLLFIRKIVSTYSPDWGKCAKFPVIYLLYHRHWASLDWPCWYVGCNQKTYKEVCLVIALTCRYWHFIFELLAIHSYWKKMYTYRNVKLVNKRFSCSNGTILLFGN